MIELKNLTKRFPGVNVLDDVSFSVQRGTVHALVGENGAGKSTIVRILAGINHPDSGEILFDGQPCAFKTPKDSIRAGISVVHQEIKLSETLTVAENIYLGQLPRKGLLIDWPALISGAERLLSQMGLSLNVHSKVNTLSVAQKQMVEICRAVRRNCRVLIMDEPSASLTGKEQRIMMNTVKALRDQGLTIVYISHRMDEIFELADNVTILRDGRHIRTCSIKEITLPEMITAMVGRPITSEYPPRESSIGETVLEVRNIVRKNIVRNISFELRQGEILGLSGLIGAGRTELMHAVLGIDPIDSGEVILRGRKLRLRSFRDAIRHGFALIPEDRKLQGLVQIQSIQHNIGLVNLEELSIGPIIRQKLERRCCEKYTDQLSISPAFPDNEVQYLSGGNQQKVVIAKWLMKNADIIVLDEPTRGIDVGGKAEIYQLMRSLTRDGKSIIMISSDIPEIVGMSDRVIVIHEGKKVVELDDGQISPEEIMRHCL